MTDDAATSPSVDHAPAKPETCRRDPRLDELALAFERGDYARVRSRAPALESSPDQAVRDAARALLDRTKPDPLAVLILVLTAALLAIVTVYWAIHGKAPEHQQLPGAPSIERVRS
jgi:hypothetical protein